MMLKSLVVKWLCGTPASWSQIMAAQMDKMEMVGRVCQCPTT